MCIYRYCVNGRVCVVGERAYNMFYILTVSHVTSITLQYVSEYE